MKTEFLGEKTEELLRELGVNCFSYPCGKYTYFPSCSSLAGEKPVWEVFHLLDERAQKRFWEQREVLSGWYWRLLREESSKEKWELKFPSKEEYFYVLSERVISKS